MTVHNIQKSTRAISAGDVIRIRMYAVHRVNIGLVSITKFEILQNCPNIVYTPLCIQTLPQPLTMHEFREYLQLAFSQGASSEMNASPSQLNRIPSQASMPPSQFNVPPSHFNIPPSPYDMPPSQFNTLPSQFNTLPSQFNTHPSQFNTHPSQFNTLPSHDWRSSLNQSVLDVTSPNTSTPSLPQVATDFRAMHPIGETLVPSSHLDFALRYVFQYPSYRDDQREIVASAIAGHDVFVLKCTGGGKSLCFQVPAVLSKGVTIVFCPLLSLLQDQIESLLKRPCGGIPCAYLSGDCVRFVVSSHAQPRSVKDKVYQELGSSTEANPPCLKLLYLTPELFELNSRLQLLLHRLHRDVSEIGLVYGIGKFGPICGGRSALH